VLNLEVVINLVHTSVVVSLPDWAAYSYSEEVGDSENYGPPKYSAYQLAPGVEAHATQFQHNIFESNQPYARRLHVLAVKRCSVVLLRLYPDVERKSQSRGSGHSKDHGERDVRGLSDSVLRAPRNRA
jgi:hypothetical protein